MKQIVHIGFGDSAAGSLRAAIKLGLPGDKVVVSRDDFTQGPISDCILDGGLSQRSQYWSTLKTLHPRQRDTYEHYASTIKGINSIPDNSTVVLWLGNSTHDELAVAWLISYLSTKTMDWKYVDLKSNFEFRNVSNLAMLSTEQICFEYNQVKVLTSDLQGKYKELWSILSIENSQYRVLNENQVISVEDSFHDTFILSQINKKEQLLGKLLGAIMNKAEHRLTDVTIESRLVALQLQNKISIELSIVSVFMSKVKLR